MTLTFLKLGGSLITDKSKPETARKDVIVRLADEISAALKERPDLQLLIGHGSGSFGHHVANKYNTRAGVHSADDWRGFAQVSVVAARLNQIVQDIFSAAGVPVMRFQPSASALSADHRIMEMSTEPIKRALEAGLTPLVFGDVGFDDRRGGTILSTEDSFTYLAEVFSPYRILLAGKDDGVFDQHGELVPHITPGTVGELSAVLSGSEATDVTGGMSDKVQSMLALCESSPQLEILIFNGAVPGRIYEALTGEQFPPGTRLSANR